MDDSFFTPDYDSRERERIKKIEEINKKNRAIIAKRDEERSHIENEIRKNRLSKIWENAKVGKENIRLSYKGIYPDDLKRGISGVYKIVNVSNGLYYIGSAPDILDRLRKHFYKLSRETHSNPSLQAAYNDSPSTWKAEIVEKTELNNHLEREQYYLDTLQPWAWENRGYNYGTIAVYRDNAKCNRFGADCEKDYTLKRLNLDLLRLSKLPKYKKKTWLKHIETLENKIKMLNIA